jgi:hypothetical protein
LSERICENSIRIATTIAVGRNARAVGRRDIEFAIDLCSRSFDAVVGGVERYMFERFEFPRLCEVVFNKIASVGGKMSTRDLKRTFRNNQSWGNELDRALRYLEDEERIKESDNVGTSNRASPGWVIVEDKA